VFEVTGESAELPRSAEGTRQEFARVCIPDDVFFFYIPFYFAADEHRNKAQVTRDRGMMGGFCGSDRGFSAFDAIKKVALVIVRFVELNLA
jgi:hypothetical protein